MSEAALDPGAAATAPEPSPYPPPSPGDDATNNDNEEMTAVSVEPFSAVGLPPAPRNVMFRSDIDSFVVSFSAMEPWCLRTFLVFHYVSLALLVLGIVMTVLGSGAGYGHDELMRAGIICAGFFFLVTCCLGFITAWVSTLLVVEHDQGVVTFTWKTYAFPYLSWLSLDFEIDQLVFKECHFVIRDGGESDDSSARPPTPVTALCVVRQDDDSLIKIGDGEASDERFAELFRALRVSAGSVEQVNRRAPDLEPLFCCFKIFDSGVEEQHQRACAGRVDEAEGRGRRAR